jgi:hypothetical protein
VMGLFRSTSGVRIGADISCGGEVMLLDDDDVDKDDVNDDDVNDDDVDDDDVDGPESRPRMSAINVAAVCRLYAKFKKELRMASWISRLGSLCSFVFEVLTRAALTQQNIGSENDMILGEVEG